MSLRSHATKLVSDITTSDVTSRPISPYWVLIGIFIASCFGGLAALLRSEKVEMTPRRIVSAMLNSGFMSTIIALFMLSKYPDPHGPPPSDLFYLIAVSLLAGFGGALTVDILVQKLVRTIGVWQDKKDDADH